MAPNPHNVPIERDLPKETFSRPLLGDEVVISGISGMFPKSDSTMELMENLYNQVDMVEEVSFDTIKHPHLPKHLGKVKNVSKFDAQFFRVTHWQANTLDPMSKKIMEAAFSAIYDSGINPLSVSGTKLGVFIGSSYADMVVFSMYDFLTKNNYRLPGCSKTMQANRISYWIDGKGPSYQVDEACASSMTCLALAYESIKRGDCDSALVGGCNTCLHPGLTLNLKNAGHLCLDGKTKTFDKNGDGYVRSEAVSILFLQKAKDAKRIYSEIYHVKGKYFARPDDNFLGIRRSDDILKFLQEFYSEVKLSPSEIEYIEAFGLGIAEADGNELDAIGRHFAQSRAVKVGCVKSNMGHTEAANGLCAVTKVCLAYHKGELPGNLHYSEPQDHIPAVRDGRLKVLTENTSFNRGFSAVNSFSYTGSNYHVLLKGHYKSKDITRYHTDIPRLVLLSGRNETGINKVLDVLSSQPVDPEQIAMFHNIHKTNFPGHTQRSYIILDTNDKNETVSLKRSIDFYPGTYRPIWFMYSGMGSQWTSMGTELMRIPIFADAIRRCDITLNEYGVNVTKIITDTNKNVFDNILHSMVGITAIQIGLTDVLTALNIHPDNIIGHSLGEIGCAYADGGFTAEQAILSAYFRGVVSLQTPLIKGSMAAVGLGYKDVLPLCPPEVDVACHNSDTSATISGPAEVMDKFVSELVSRGVFAKQVPSSNIAYHSRYMAIAAPVLLPKMQDAIKNPKLRSDKWISTSVKRDNWDQDYAKYASAEYFTNNLLNPVYFEEHASVIPDDAIIIEIAPHGLMQAILKKSHAECLNVPLTKRMNPDPVSFLLQAVGKLYQTGLNPHIDALYPKVEFPVSTETPLLSHLVEWEHSADWPEIAHTKKDIHQISSRDFVISIHDDDHAYLKGHVRNGVNEFPESTFLVLVWETLGMHRGKHYKDMSVAFHDVMFHTQVKIKPEEVLRLKITIENATDRFEVINGSTQVVTGIINEIQANVPFEKQINRKSNDMNLNNNVLYALSNMKGYSYSDEFQSIHSYNVENGTAYVKWNNKWATFIDSLLQVSALSKKHDGVSTPKIINKLSIHVGEHRNVIPNVFDSEVCLEAELCKSDAAVRCGGVSVEGLIFEDLPKLKHVPELLLTREFVPHEIERNVDLQTAISINLQLVADNVKNDEINVTEIVSSASESISSVIKMAADEIPYHTYNINVVDIANDYGDTLEASQLVVLHGLSGYKEISSLINKTLENGAFVLTLERNINKLGDKCTYEVITKMSVNNEVILLLKKADEYEKENVLYFPVNLDTKFSWVPRVASELKKTRRVVLVSEKQPYCGLLGFVKHLKKDKNNKIGLVFIEDYNTLSFSPDNDNYNAHLRKNLAFNVLKKGLWGSYYYVKKPISVAPTSVSLTSKNFKDLDNFVWTEKPAPSKNKIQISYSAVSARDCQRALGKVNDGETSFGMDFSGVDANGARVMGVVPSGTLSDSVEADPTLTWPVPSYWTLEDAATVPLPYIHAYYCLVIKGHIARKQTVYVTGGAGALGQAVIAICLSLDCTVFTTVGDRRKKNFLLKLFPKLKEDHVGFSRHDTYYTKVIEMNNNQRCDIVINCSTGPLRQAARKCVGFMGLLLDVVHTDMHENKTFGMHYFTENKHYKVANVSTIFKPENEHERKILHSLLAEGIASGVVKPLSRVVYTPQNVTQAFQLVSSNRHRGKTLIKMDDLKLYCSKMNVLPRMTYSNGTHIVVCDRHNLGVELVDHLIKNGAKHCIVHVKPNTDTTYLHAKSTYWRNFNVTIDLNSENLQTKEGCERLLNVAQKQAPIAGIYVIQENTGPVDDDIENNNYKLDFNETVMVTAHLDAASRNTCNQLSNFVLISVNSENLSNAYTISACERICEARRNIGLPGLVVKTTATHEITNSNEDLLLKLQFSTLSRLFNAMDISLKLNNSNVLAIDLNNKPENKIISNIETLGPQNGEHASTSKVINTTEGLGAFFNNIESEEYAAVDSWVPMKTLLPKPEEAGCTNRYEDHLLMIPGFEGHHHVFNGAAERLKILAATLQLGPDLICDSIPEMAKVLANIIKTNYVYSSKFYILGYSFGVNVALEVAKLLEAEGRTGIVYCLDSSPDALKTQLNAYLGNLTETQLQNNILEHMYYLLTKQSNPELKKDLEQTDDWAPKVEICMKHLRGKVNHSYEHQRSLLQSAYNRIKLAKEYKPNVKLESEIVLMRGAPHPRAENLAEDYNLSQYTNHPVKVFHIQAPHSTAPYDCRVPNIVNKMLDENLLKEFEKKNLCDIYYCD